MASTHRSSYARVSGCSGTHTGVLDDGLEPDTGRIPSNSNLVVVHREKSKGPPSRCHVSYFQDWKWEILCLVTSLALLLGVFIMLMRYNRGEQPEWPYNININSLVSIITTIVIAQLGFILAQSMYCTSVTLPPRPAPQTERGGRVDSKEVYPTPKDCAFGHKLTQGSAVISQLKWSWFRQPHPLQDLDHYDAASRGIIGSIMFLCRFASRPRA